MQGGLTRHPCINEVPEAQRYFDRRIQARDPEHDTSRSDLSEILCGRFEDWRVFDQASAERHSRPETHKAENERGTCETDDQTLEQSTHRASFIFLAPARDYSTFMCRYSSRPRRYTSKEFSPSNMSDGFGRYNRGREISSVASLSKRWNTLNSSSQFLK